VLKRIVSVFLTVWMTAIPITYVRAEIPSADRPYWANTPQQSDLLSEDQIDNILAPIALYPDPLLAQVLPASTYVDQIDQAARHLRANNNDSKLVDKQDWDVSVKSIAHYPQIVYMMSEKLDWTTALGKAYVMQSKDVLSSIQRLRARAREAGNLASNQQQKVIVEKQIIMIEPAQPQVIYVPTYNPQVVYVKSGPSTGTVIAATVIAFGAGLAIGAWLNRGWNWHGGGIYYHGWRGGGWIGRSSVHVRVNNNIYVNRRYANVNINRTIVNRPVNYNRINHYSRVNRNVNYNNINRTNVNRNNINRNRYNNSNLNKNVNRSNRDLNQYRGRTNPSTTRPTGSRNRNNANRSTTQRRSPGFSGGKQTRVNSQRGKTSRASRSTRRQPRRRN
jgi:hypothetical protein